MKKDKESPVVAWVVDDEKMKEAREAVKQMASINATRDTIIEGVQKLCAAFQISSDEVANPSGEIFFWAGFPARKEENK